MKKIFTLGLALLSFSALANYQQDSSFMQKMERMPAAAEGMRHMFEFNVDSVLSGAISFEKSKIKGSGADNDTKANLSFNYAYGIASFLQVGTRFNYFSGIAGGSDLENFEISFGGILNTMEDFTQSAYLSLYFGAGWAQDFGGSTRDDLRLVTMALGKRLPLDRWGLKNVTYTPEIALKSVTSTNDSSLDYSQALELRFLQFSVFF